MGSGVVTTFSGDEKACRSCGGSGAVICGTCAGDEEVPDRYVVEDDPSPTAGLEGRSRSPPRPRFCSCSRCTSSASFEPPSDFRSGDDDGSTATENDYPVVMLPMNE